jgi:hypothetical protein
MTTDSSIVACPAILSIIGWHAKEPPIEIVERKAGDIERAGISLWAYQSWKARTEAVQEFAHSYAKPTVFFLEGSAAATGTDQAATQMSQDGVSWKDLPMGIGKVTGKLKGASGLVLGELSAVTNQMIDLWEYLEHPSLQPLRFQLGASTACVIPSPNGPVSGMKSRVRRVVAIGRLAHPFAVFLR